MGAGVPFVLLYVHLSVNRNLYMKLKNSKNLFSGGTFIMCPQTLSIGYS